MPLFRRIWIASVLSNLGFLFLSVGTAWQMTALTAQAGMVTLVQTALMLPMMLLCRYRPAPWPTCTTGAGSAWFRWRCR